jgi:hypothetical protein
MARVDDFLRAQPADIHNFVLDAVTSHFTDPAYVAEAIKRQYPGRFSDEEISLLIAGAMYIMK